jgi:hypothetical protein
MRIGNKRRLGMGLSARAVAFVLLLICLVLAAVLVASRAGQEAVGGAAPGASHRRPRGPDPAASPHVVVDTLNVAHWYLQHEAARAAQAEPASLTPAAIIRTIDATAPLLKRQHEGRVYYVLKDRESQFNDAAVRAAYQAAGRRNEIWISLAERYPEPPAGPGPTAEHSSRGRDDFYMSLLARRYRCAVVTADKLRDFSRFRATIPPFYVLEYAYWRDQPEREYIRPDSPAYAPLRRPRLIHPADLFGGL